MTSWILPCPNDKLAWPNDKLDFTLTKWQVGFYLNQMTSCVETAFRETRCFKLWEFVIRILNIGWICHQDFEFRWICHYNFENSVNLSSETWKFGEIVIRISKSGEFVIRILNVGWICHQKLDNSANLSSGFPNSVNLSSGFWTLGAFAIRNLKIRWICHQDFQIRWICIRMLNIPYQICQVFFLKSPKYDKNERATAAATTTAEEFPQTSSPHSHHAQG